MTATLTDVDLLLHLDFEPALPCQLRAHDTRCAAHDPAAWRVFGWCPGCGRRLDIIICESGRKRKLSAATNGCGLCGHTHWWPTTYTIIPLDGA